MCCIYSAIYRCATCYLEWSRGSGLQVTEVKANGVRGGESLRRLLYFVTGTPGKLHGCAVDIAI